jgi:uncharacterized damage-inducible protein DinB
MIHIEDYAKMLSNEHEIVLKQTADLSHADSLRQPQPGGNCLNWTLGHLVDNLKTILSILGGEAPGNLPNVERYQHNSDPIRGEGPGVLPLNQLLNAYELLTQTINERLGQMKEEEFEEEIELWGHQTRRGWEAFFFFFHNTYHIGQLEYLRNLAGKLDKII